MVFINKANKRRKAFFLSAIVVVVMLTAFCGCGKKEEMLLVSKNNGDTGSIGEKEGEAKAGGGMSDGGMSDGGMSGGGMSDAADNIGEPVNGIEKITHQSIFVYICGAVYVPGVYEIKPDARIYEIVEQAGGLLPEADPTKVNLALGLEDGQMIYIPYFGEDMVLDNQNTNEDNTNEENTKIDINSATTHELCKLPGIGEAKAKAIIAYREKNGAFSKISDIKKVSGIKDALYESIKDYIVAGKGK